MSEQFRSDAELAIGAGDMRRLLTEIVCPPYGAFGALRVADVHEVEGGGFVLMMKPKVAPAPVQAVKPEEAKK